MVIAWVESSLAAGMRSSPGREPTTSSSVAAQC
jgi:hypothetical protein